MLVMKIIGSASGDVNSYTGKYLKAFDPNAYDGRGSLEVTTKVEEALQFKTIHEVFETWRKNSDVRPHRPDGEPNRPLTAFSIEIKSI